MLPVYDVLLLYVFPLTDDRSRGGINGTCMYASSSRRGLSLVLMALRQPYTPPIVKRPGIAASYPRVTRTMLMLRGFDCVLPPSRPVSRLLLGLAESSGVKIMPTRRRSRSCIRLMGGHTKVGYEQESMHVLTTAAAPAAAAVAAIGVSLPTSRPGPVIFSPKSKLDTHTRTLVESFGSLLRSAKITHPQNTAREDFQVRARSGVLFRSVSIMVVTTPVVVVVLVVALGGVLAPLGTSVSAVSGRS